MWFALALVLGVRLLLSAALSLLRYRGNQGIGFRPLAPSSLIYIRCEGDADGFALAALAGPPADTQSYSSVG